MRYTLALAAIAFVFPAAIESQTAARKDPPHAPTVKPSVINKANLEAYLRHMELWTPQVQVKIDDPKPFATGLYEVEVHLSAGAATKSITYYVTSDGRKVLRGTAHDLHQNPFQAALDLMKLDNAPAFGPPQAKLTVVAYSDFQCPLCKEEAKSLREHLPKQFAQDARVIFKNYPLESIHPWAKPAAIAARCVYRAKPEAFWDYHDWIFEHQSEIKPDNLRTKILEWAKTKTLDVNGLGTCMDTKATESEVQQEISEAKQLDVDSTPTLFLNGRRLVGNIPWETLAQILRMELEFRK